MTFKLVSDWLDPSKFSSNIFPEDSVVVTDNPLYHEDDKKLILMMVEPEAIKPFRKQTMENAHRFYRIYTCDEEILAMLPEKAIKVVGNYTLLKPDEIEKCIIEKKEFKVSSWAATKLFPGVPGHHLRAVLYFNQKLFPENFVFFRTSRPYPYPPPPLGPILPDINNNPFFENKVPLFETFQFAITIENSKQKNYFTEKIIDCLVARSIPIYWGCPNISEFFDTSGWIFFDDSDDLLKKISILDENYYSRYIETINNNFLEAMKYSNEHENIERHHRLALE